MKVQTTFVVRDGVRCPVLVAVVAPGEEMMHVKILRNGKVEKIEMTVTEYFNLPKETTNVKEVES